MATRLIPTEEQEQIAFVQWCQANHYIVHHSGNEIGGSTAAIKARAVKMKKMGTSKGFPDLLVFLPVNDPLDDEEDIVYEPVAIEMKRQRGGVLSQDQSKWLKIMANSGISSYVCRGCEEAINVIKEKVAEMKG